jgi:hypothetical protein
MCGSILCLAVVALGVDAGWQPLPDGGLEYIIQIEPHLVGQLQPGAEIISHLNPEAKGVRSVRICVGTADLPRRSLPAPAGTSWTLPEDSSAFAETGPILDPFQRPRPKGHGATSSLQEPLQPVRPRSNPAAAPSAALAPNPLNFDPGPKPIDGQPAAFLQETVEPTVPEASSSSDVPAGETVPPWAWTVTLGALVASIGGMLYLGWVALDYRSRYRRLLDRLFEGNRQPWLDDGSDQASMPS